MSALPIGKLPHQLLKSMIDRYVAADARIVVGPGVGEDAAVIDMGDRYLVAKTDPITFATDEIGWYAVHVNANDVVCCGAVPRWYLATLLLPEEKTTAEMVESIFAQMSRACRELEISLCGGHTEITYSLDRPIIVGQMLGEVEPGRQITSGGARPGDAIVLTKGIAVEGTSLIAREKPDELGDFLSVEEVKRYANFLHEPGISVVGDAQAAIEAGGVHALHDPTEGGVATGLWELAEAAGVGLVIDKDKLSIFPECRRLCEHFGLDPLGLIGSGALLIAAEPESARPIVEGLAGAGISATIIGSVTDKSEGCTLRAADGSLQPLPVFPRDEIARLFD